MAQELFRLTAHGIREGLEAGTFSASEVVESFLARIDAVDGRVEAFATVWSDEARGRAALVDAGKLGGPLAGVPVVLKDNFCTVEGTTGCGSKILADYQSPYDGTVVRRLKDAGAIILGKVNMDEFAMGSSTENSSLHVTKNPWDLERVPGGSSGGAAAAVAADETALGFGSDTGGSIRQPAAFCGCVGFKPTYGRVSRYGLVAFASSLDQIGPMTKDVEDAALALSVICGRDPLDGTSADVAAPESSTSLIEDIEGLRIGMPSEYFSDALNDEMGGVIREAVKLLRERGAIIEEISLPHTEYAVATYYIICTAEASANLARFDGVRYGFRHEDAGNVEDVFALSRSEGFGAEVKRRIMLGTYALSSGYYDAYYKKAQQVRTLIRGDFDRAFESVDVIVTPTTPTPAFRIGEKSDDPLEMYLADIYTTSANLAGIPAVSVPCGMMAEGLPVGMQLLGKSFDEATLLRVGYSYERARGGVGERAPVT